MWNLPYNFITTISAKVVFLVIVWSCWKRLDNLFPGLFREPYWLHNHVLWDSVKRRAFSAFGHKMLFKSISISRWYISYLRSIWWYQSELLGKESDTIISSTDSFHLYLHEWKSWYRSPYSFKRAACRLLHLKRFKFMNSNSMLISSVLNIPLPCWCLFPYNFKVILFVVN